MQDLIAKNLDHWTSAIAARATAGRGTNGTYEQYGIRKLRHLILTLACSGKLIEQDPMDAPASQLIEKIAARRESLEASGDLRKQKPLPCISEDDSLCSLPSSWVWTRLGTISNYGQAEKIEPADAKQDTWVLDLEDIEKETSRLLQKNRFKEKPFRSSKNVFHRGDVIYGKLRPYLDKVLVADEDGACTTEMIPFNSFGMVVSEYLKIAMKCPKFIEYANQSTHGMNLPRLGTEAARMAPIPLAPYNEQLRIVAKVDELMTLCDQLEQKQSTSLEAHQTLVATLLDTLTRAESATDFQQAWQRIATHFDTLFATEHSIDQLKQIIKQLAIMGKIVRQDQNDGPALTLLEKLGKEKRQFRKPGLTRKSTEFSSAPSSDLPFSIPVSWNVVRLGELTLKIGSGSTPRGGKSAYLDAGIPFLRSQNIWNDGLKMEDVAYISKATHERMSNTIVQANDLLLNITGASLGRCTIFPDSIGEANVSQHVTIIRPALPALHRYLHYFFLSPYAQSLIWGRQVGVAREGLSKKVLEQFEVPLPPLAEQQRIVARLDQLLSICESMGHRLQRGKAIQCQIADTIVKEALN